MATASYDILRSVTKDILSHLPVAEILQRATDIISEKLELPVCSIYTYDQLNNTLVLRASSALRACVGMKMKPNEGLTGRVHTTQRFMNIQEPSASQYYKEISGSGEEKFRSYLGVPMMTGQVCVGVLVLQNEENDCLSERIFDIAMILSQQLAAVVYQEDVGKVLSTEQEQQQALEDTQDDGEESLDFTGTIISKGVAYGEVRLHLGTDLWEKLELKYCDDQEKELNVFREALTLAREETTQIQERASEIFIESDASIFFAQLMLLEDDKLIGDIEELILEQSYEAKSAVKVVVEKYIELFLSMEQVQMRERSLDLTDIGIRLVAQISGANLHHGFKVDRQFIYAGNEIMPSDLVRIPFENLLAIVCAKGGSTSHAAILARSLQVPAVMGIGTEALSKIKKGDYLFVDGDAGACRLNPDQEALVAYKDRLNIRRQRSTDPSLKRVAQTKDGTRVKVQANICMFSDFNLLKGMNYDGVGLYRTEFMYMVHDNFPSESEQYRIYRSMIKKAGPAGITMRVLDIGGDKPLKYFDNGDEKEAMLGYRSIRMLLDHPDIFRPHLRAMLRASQRGNVRILFPMVAHVEDAIAMRNITLDVLRELRQSYGENFKLPPIGAMVEVPSAVWQLEHILDYMDFVSVGTNDLVQYSFAVDRGNPRVASYFTPVHPVMLTVLAQILQTTLRVNKSVSICGEVASNPRALPILLGIGLRELSMSPAVIETNRLVIHQLDIRDCQALAIKVLQAKQASEVEALLDGFFESKGIQV